MKWEVRDVLAILFFIILSVLLYLGSDGVILSLLGLVVGFYFGDKRSSVQAERDSKGRVMIR